MSKKPTDKESTKLVDTVVKGIQEKKGNEIVVIDLRDIHNSVCDYFVICHGDSSTQVKAIADFVEDETRKEIGDKPWHTEGQDNSEWILLDYVNVVVHVFHREAREFYSLEKLWADAPIQEIEYAV
jgi:ribosome-associated protein